MVTGPKTKVCKYCGAELVEGDTPKRRLCAKCAGARMMRWFQLAHKAQQRLAQEWPEKY